MPFSLTAELSGWKRFLCLTFTLGAGALVLARTASAQPAEAAAEPAAEVITSIRQFWNLTAAERKRSHAFRLECDITYYDAFWKNLWIQDTNEGTYVAVGNRKFSFKADQHLVIRGTFEPPNSDLSFANAEVESVVPTRLSPVSATGQMQRADFLGNRLVTLECFVVRQVHIDPEHLQLTLSAESETVVAYVMVDPGKPLPDYTDTTVRIQGVYVPTTQDSGGRRVSLEMRVASPDKITTLSWLGNDPRFKLAPSPIESLPKLSRSTLVRVVGKVKAQEPGRYLRIRDDSGQVDLLSGQTRMYAIDEQVEAIGYPGVEGTEWKLNDAIFRSLTSPMPLTRGTPNSALRVAAQVLELSPDEAAAGRPVLFSGVVTWSHPDSPLMYVQDASGGVCVSRGALTGKMRAVGTNVEVKGRTAVGSFSPMVVATQISRLGELVLPEARQISLELALSGVEEAQWVEIRGYLRKVTRTGAFTLLELSTSAGNFQAEVPASDELVALEGAVVRVHGVCTAEADDRRKLTGIKLLVPGPSYVQVEESAPKDLFDQPARLLANLGQFGTLQSFNRRVKVSGIVLHHAVGRFINIVEGEESLMVLSRQTIPLTPGDRIDAVGFLGRQGGRSVLRESVYRKLDRGVLPQPRMLTDPANVRAELDGHLVNIDATLIDESVVADHVRLTLQDSNVVFEAYLQVANTLPQLASWRIGSVLRLTGVYETKYGEEGSANSFLIRLRSPADITVLVRPSPLTRGRILTFSGALAVGILAFIAWVMALRRRVRQQTQQIRGQLQREARLESDLQRATKLESLGILAGGIAHDFNNLLTVVMGNLSLAMMDLAKESESTGWLREAERAVGRARDLTQQLLTFSKGGAPIRAAVALADIVREVAEFALRGSNVRCDFDLSPDLWPADVDKGQIGQVVQNIVINAMQVMPNGGLINIVLLNETNDPGLGKILAPGRYLKLTITDHGAGIAPDNLGRIFEPYFTTKKTGNGLGLATVYSIVKKHSGHIIVESVVGRGTSFHIWLPAATSLPEMVEEQPIPVYSGRGRVLFLDDDPEIRRLGQAMLGRLGYEVTAVADGSEVITEYRRSLNSSAPFDFVILDLTVPGGVGGCEAMAQLLKIDPNVKAIVSSGYSNDEVMANFRKYGFSGIVSKPYETAALAQALSQLMQRAVV